MNTTFLKSVNKIVVNYISPNKLNFSELPPLIDDVIFSLTSKKSITTNIQYKKATPRQIKNSINPQALVSFIDGKPYKFLSRHLSKHGMSMEKYREAFGLPDSYPSTCSELSKKRAKAAKRSGLGRKNLWQR
jgi:predicted transcriptional regulator